jgi:hypothetical protein
MFLDFEYIEGTLPNEQSVAKDAVDCRGLRRIGEGSLETVAFFETTLAEAFFFLTARVPLGATSSAGARSAMQTSSDPEELFEYEEDSFDCIDESLPLSVLYDAFAEADLRGLRRTGELLASLFFFLVFILETELATLPISLVK